MHYLSDPLNTLVRCLKWQYYSYLSIFLNSQAMRVLVKANMEI